MTSVGLWQNEERNGKEVSEQQEPPGSSDEQQLSTVI